MRFRLKHFFLRDEDMELDEILIMNVVSVPNVTPTEHRSDTVLTEDSLRLFVFRGDYKITLFRL